MNKQVIDNFKKVRLWHFALAAGVFALILIALKVFGLSDSQTYPQANKGLFLFINALWADAPTLAHNLTYLGDASVILALLLCFALRAPKVWEALIAGSLLSLILTRIFKLFYAMPRPARAFGEDAFNIIGETLKGANSLPSGHTITIVTALCVVFCAFVPSARKWRAPLALGIVALAALVGLSRIGVGAHYPLDVLAGAALGCVCGIFGVIVASKTRIFAWLESRFGLLIFALFSAICVVILLKYINKYSLLIHYFALTSAIICLFIFLRAYFKQTLSANAAPIAFILIFSTLWVVFFHFPLLGFIRANLALDSLSAALFFVSLVVFLFALTAFIPLLLSLISFKITKAYFALFSLTNALAVYFIATYGVFLDKTMMGNLFNTNPAEAGEFLSLKMALWIVALGVAPACFALLLNESPRKANAAKPPRKANATKSPRKALLKFSAFTLVVLLILAGLNFKNLLWFDKHAKQLGALIMPWSYTINSGRFLASEFSKNKKEIPLPDARIADDKKAALVLVIGESARAKNFSLYGYGRETNPLLSKVPNLRRFYAKSSTTYTSASVKNMLSHKDSGTLYEILPNYLNRAGVSVLWRESNWGAPPIRIPSENIANYAKLASLYAKSNDGFESAMVAGLGEAIKAAQSPKVLIILHTSTSHGPTYFKKYPPEFERFTPVCKSVEPKGCSQGEIVNAYDNTILYTDFLLHAIITQLSALQGIDSAMIYASDHGESLGENGVFMHGIPMAFAPKEQFEIPFIVWSSNPSAIKNLAEASHFHIFHSALAFLGVESEVFDGEMSLFNKAR